MLVLTRRSGEEIVLSGGIRINVVAVQGNRVRLGVTAPPEVSVNRREVAQRQGYEAAEAAVPECQPCSRSADERPPDFAGCTSDAEPARRTDPAEHRESAGSATVRPGSGPPQAAQRT
jgi:carbon storage regulator